MAELLEPLAGANARAVATRLIGRFGSLARALDASADRQLSLNGEDANVLRQLRAPRELNSIALREELVRGSILPTAPQLLAYLRQLLANLRVEKVHATFLGADRGYIADEILVTGSGHGIELHARALIERALELGTRALILAHNHPSGSAEPSAQDVRSTQRLENLLTSLEIELIDHLVVGRRSIVSMREGGYL